MIIALVPWSSCFKKILMKLTVTTDLVDALDVLVALEEDQEAGPDKVGIAGSFAQEERAIRVFLKKSLDLIQNRLGGIPRLLATFLPVQLV